jgi:hypothetical protein
VSDIVQCDVHGSSLETFVCKHIAETLADGSPRGFRWFVDDEGDYQATCDTCSELPDAEWEARQGELGRILCLGCFGRAASLNGVIIESTH